jgi:hypothetical protein
VTTEHFTLQGARTAAITESTSRATIFIGAVSAGLVALRLIATATRIGVAFYAFGLILLSTLSSLASSPATACCGPGSKSFITPNGSRG